MATVSVSVFFHTLRSLLKQAEMAQLTGTLQAPNPDLAAIARDLCQRGWLTAFQARQLLLGKGAGLVLGPYILLDLLGSGGRGQVFKARHRAMNRLVALKLLNPDLLADQEAVRRFFREVEVTSQFSHPAIVHAYDAGVVGATYYLAMEYVEGRDLERLVQEQGRLPAVLACDYIRQAAEGLEYAHQRGLVHRDIKPSNLLLTRSAETSGHSASRVSRSELVKILDLGLARLRQPVEGSRTKNLTVLAGGSAMQGTPDYMSPEQALDFHKADTRSDIYSLGCTFYYLLTGHPPFGGSTLAEKLVKHQQVEPPPIEGDTPGLPAEIGPILRKMMAKRLPDRYQTPGDVAEALSAVIASRGSVAARTAIREADSTMNFQDEMTPLSGLPAPPAQAQPGKRGNRFKRMIWYGTSTTAALFLLLGGAWLLFLFRHVERSKKPALYLDGKESVPLPNDLFRASTHLTAEVWFKTKSGGVIIGYQKGPYPTGGGEYVPMLYVGTDGLLRGELWNGAVRPVTSKSAVNDDQWHHTCLVADATAKTQSLYLNGTLVGTQSGDVLHLGMSDNQIGTGFTSGWPQTNGNWYGFTGTLAELRVWHRALSASEIESSRRQAPRATEPGLVLYLPMDEADGAALVDRAPGHHTVQLVAGTTGQLPRRIAGGPPIR